MWKIDYLTVRQVELLDILWDLNTFEDVQNFMENLTTEEQYECKSLMELIMLEEMDKVTNLMVVFPEVTKILSKL